MSAKALIIGLGDVGGWALEFLARAPGVDSIAVADIRADWGEYRTNLAAIGAAMSGQDKSFEFHRVDLSDVSADVAYAIDRESRRSHQRLVPAIPPVCHGAVVQDPGRGRGAGPCRANHRGAAPVASRSRLQCDESQGGVGLDIPVVNVSFADVVNPMLWGAGVGAVCGAGNCEHLAYEIRRAIAVEHERPQDAAQVFLVSGGSAMLHAGPGKLPYFLKLTVDGRDVTPSYDTKALIESAIESRFFRGEGQAPLFSTPAASAVKNALAIAQDTQELMTVNSPLGLPGDYPTRLGARGAELVLPDELSREEAEEIGRAALPVFGFSAIEEDGTAIYSDETRDRLKDLLGYDCPRIHPSEAWVRARELMQAYRGFLDLNT